MILSLGRARRALVQRAGIMLALATALAIALAPAAHSAPIPKIVSVDIEGNVHLPSSRILSVLTARPGELYDPRIVQADLARLNALGYFADIAPPLVRQRPGGIAITYRVIENPVLTKIVFNGNTHVPGDTLLALMDSSVGQVFNTNTFRQDVLKINSYYEQVGYRGQVPTHVKDLNLDSHTGVLTLQIQEGLTIRRVIIAGDPLLPPTVILPVLNVKPGVEYSDALRDKDIDVLKTLYDKYDLLVGNFEGGIDPTSVDLKAGTADVKYDVFVARVGAVQITGNTKTHDDVIRRELRLRPGMIITNSGLRRDYDRLNNTGYFSKVDLTPKEGPDPKAHPEYVTLDWNVTEQKTASASVGFGYSGGITGQGLYGTLGYSDSNLHGTGNAVNLQYEKGARTYSAQLSTTIPYIGKTPRSQKYSVTAQLFGNGYTYLYPVYAVTTTGTIPPSPGSTPAPVPVTLFPNGPAVPLSGVVATSQAKSLGVSAQIARRMNDYTRVLLGGSGQKISNSTTVPAPFFFQGGQPNIIVGPTPGPIGSNINNTNGSFGINATSIANINTGQPYSLTYVTLGLQTDTRDDVFNPRRGVNISFLEKVSTPSLGSSFNYTTTTIDASKFFPILKSATLGVHAQLGTTTGAIPPSELYTFSDQQMRGYDSVFYGTDVAFGQIELRQPVTQDRRLTLAAFIDQLGYRIRGAQPLTDPFTNRIISYPGNWVLRGDYGVGIRFDVPQLGIHTVRIDFARGLNGSHTSFGIGQSF